MPTVATRPEQRRHSPWGLAVTVSAAVMLAVSAAFALWWAFSTEERITSYQVRGAVNGVTLDLDDADATIVGAEDGAPVQVRRTESFAFARRPEVRRQTEGGVLRVVVRCPDLLLGSCSSAYRIAVPANVPVNVRSSSGDVRFSNYRGTARIDTGTGNIDVGAYCGNSLRARAGSGSVRARTSCAPQRLELRSQEGDVRAIVPVNRYRVDADSDAGEHRIFGLTTAEDASFFIQALSGTGDVTVRGADG